MTNPLSETNIDKGLLLIKTFNTTSKDILLNTKKRGLPIQFHFNFDDKTTFKIIKGTYKLTMQEHDALLFFNPKNIIPIDAVIEPKGKMLSILLSLESIHRLFDDFAVDFSFFSSKYTKKKLYVKRQMSANELIIINQIYNRKIETKFDQIYIKAKILEFFTYYFNQKAQNTDNPSVSFDKNVLEKIKKAKQLLIENIDNPPSVNKLASELILPVNVLKKAFKEVHGKPIYQYILHYKLDMASYLLLSKKYSVKEISYQMGYSAPTHFIVAFKNKFGVTPKKYLQNI